MRLVPDDPGGEARLEHVPAAAVALIEQLGVAAVEALHAGRELGRRRFDDQVVVRAHEAVGVDVPVVLAFDDAEEVEEVEAIEVRAEDPSVVDPVRGDVEDAVGELAAKQSGHALDGSSRIDEFRPLRAFCHTIGTLR